MSQFGLLGYGYTGVRKVFDGSNPTYTNATSFTLDRDPGNKQAIQLFLNGYYVDESNYSLSGRVLTTSFSLAHGSLLTVIYLGLVAPMSYNPIYDYTKLINVPNLAVYDSNNKIPNANLYTGNGANQLVQLDANSKLPAVDGSNITNLPVNGQFQKMTVYSTAGTFTWSKSTGLKRVKVTLIGGGGGGGGVAYQNTTTYTGGGGGGGGISIKVIEGGSLGTTETVTVGTGGTGGTSNSASRGGTGGTSSFGSWCSSTGGTGGFEGMSGGNTYPQGGAGIGGDINGTGFIGSQRGIGYGGASFLGQGPFTGTANITGPSSTCPGSGGAGAVGNTSQGTGLTGGAGAAGIVIVEEFY